MNIWLYYLILLFLNLRSLSNTSERNLLKIEAGKAFYQKNYLLAVEKYEKLANISVYLEPEARLNLAKTYFLVKDTAKALREYNKLTGISDKYISSDALSQVAFIEAMRGDSLASMGLFKEALQKNQDNKMARYNYELLRKKFPPPPPRNNNQNNSNENQDNNGGIAENSEKRIDELESTTPEKMSKEKALQILESMKTTELQYGQQHKTNKQEKKQEKDW